MPELPEVQTVVNTLRPSVEGRTIRVVAHVRADIVHPPGFDFAAALTNRTVISITRRGKRIVFELDDRNRFFIHLGMSGRLGIEKPGAPIPKHTHLVAAISNRLELRLRDPRRFGGIFWMGKELDGSALGPEPLTLRVDQLRQRLARTTRAVKNALLDQRLIAGLGNIYVDEALFEARVHPLARSDRLSDEQTRRLSRAIKLTLRRALRHRGTTLRDYVDANGERGSFQNLHRVYDRAGEPCRSCKSPIERIVLGGRSTHFCPVCQP